MEVHAHATSPQEAPFSGDPPQGTFLMVGAGAEAAGRFGGESHQLCFFLQMVHPDPETCMTNAQGVACCLRRGHAGLWVRVQHPPMYVRTLHPDPRAYMTMDQAARRPHTHRAAVLALMWCSKSIDTPVFATSIGQHSACRLCLKVYLPRSKLVLKEAGTVSFAHKGNLQQQGRALPCCRQATLRGGTPVPEDELGVASRLASGKSPVESDPWTSTGRLADAGGHGPKPHADGSAELPSEALETSSPPPNPTRSCPLVHQAYGSSRGTLEAGAVLPGPQDGLAAPKQGPCCPVSRRRSVEVPLRTSTGRPPGPRQAVTLCLTIREADKTEEGASCCGSFCDLQGIALLWEALVNQKDRGANKHLLLPQPCCRNPACYLSRPSLQTQAPASLLHIATGQELDGLTGGIKHMKDPQHTQQDPQLPS
ncbi:hypothetical protein ABBQ32_003743 [Trebouxia sp. C0010 RCD-2024]